MGHYWEWLEAVNRLNPAKTFPQQWPAVWQTLARRAFRLPENLEEFWKRSQPLQKPPDQPDLQFLHLLAGFLDGQDVSGQLAALSSLSPAARPVWERVLSWQDSQFPEKDLRGIFYQFLIHPGRVRPQAFQDWDRVFGPQGAPVLHPSWGRHLVYLQGLFAQRYSRRTFTTVHLRPLRSLDRDLEETSCRYPPALARLVLQPFVALFARLLKFLGKRDILSAIAMVKTAPFLIATLGDSRAAPLLEKLNDSDEDETAPSFWLPLILNARGQSLEERAALLGRLRGLVSADIPDEGREFLQDFYLEILSELQERMDPSPTREQAALARILERIVTEDGRLFWQGLEEKRETEKAAAFLKKAATLQALQVKSALVAILITERFRDPELRNRALEVLQTSPPASEDLVWLLHECRDFILVRPGTLKAIMDLPIGAEPWQRLIAGWWLEQIDQTLSMTACSVDRGGLRFSPFEPEDLETAKRLWSLWTFEMTAYREYPVFALLLDYLNTFPGGVYSDQRFLGFLKRQIHGARDPGFLIDWLFDSIKRLRKAVIFAGDPTPVFFQVYGRQQAVIIDLVAGDSDLLRTADLVKIERLAEFIQQVQPRSAILSRIHRLLEERRLSGETEAGPLADKVARMTGRAPKKGKKIWKPGKRPSKS